MAGLPPLPPGFVLDTAPPPPPRRSSRPADPYALLKAEGFRFTNGYRTDGDTARIRAQGYKPATNSLHKSGDGVDLDHPTLTPAQQTRRLRQLFGGWEGAFIDDEGHHRHMQLPGWGEAPGTPGTKNSGMPPLPPGFELQQRGSLQGGNFVDASPVDVPNPFATPANHSTSAERSPASPGAVAGEGFTFSPEQKQALIGYVAKAKTPEDLDAFARSLSGGRAGIGNSAKLIGDYRKTRRLPDGVNDAPPVRRAPASPPTPSTFERLAAPLNEGIADVLGAPVDITTAGLNMLGAGIERPFLGSESIRSGLHSLGFGQTSAAYAPRSALEGYGQAISRGVGQAVLPTVGLPAAGGGLALRGASALTQASTVRAGVRQLLVETAKRPGVAAVAELAGGAGSGVGGQVARDVAPGNALAEVAGATIGGIAAGGLAGFGAVRRGARPPDRVVDDTVMGPFGPVHADLANDYPAALARLRADGSGEVPGAIKHPELGDIDLVWGNSKYGLAKIVAKHPEVVNDLPAIVERLRVKQTPAETGNGRYVLEDDTHRAIVSPDFDGDPKRWLITAYERKGAPGGQTSRRDPLEPDGGSTGVGAGDDVHLSPAANNGLPPIPDGFVLDEANAAMRATDARRAVTGEIVEPDVGRLYATSRDDLERMLSDKSLSDDDKLIRAFGEDGAAEFVRLDRARNNTFDVQRADQASAEFDRRFGDLTPEQERLAYGVGETDAQADDLRAMIQAHDDVLPGEDADWSAYMGAVAARGLNPDDFAAVAAGRGSVAAQASFLRMGKAYGNLNAAGVPTSDIPRRMAQALVDRAGWAPGQADEIIGAFVRGMEGLAPASPARAGDARLAGPGAQAASPVNALLAPRTVDRIDVASLPPIPEGFVLDGAAVPLSAPPLGRTRQMGERLPPEDIAALARGVNPEDVTPIPANRVESPDELPSTFVPVEGPGSPGRQPKKPEGFASYLRRTLASESKAKGMAVRIDADDAIDKGVPADLIYKNPRVADKSKLELRNPSLFGTRYGRMTSARQQLRSLDLDNVDPAQWGFDGMIGQRVEPEDVADLLRRDLEGDDSALARGAAYDEWSAYNERAAARDEFDARYGDDPPVERRGVPVTSEDLEAIDVPASAYEDGPRVTGKIGNINLDRLENPGDVSRLVAQVRAQVGGFDEASRGVVTNKETRALADELGLTPEQLLKRRRGQALNAEELYATRVLVQKSREVVAGLAKASQGGTDEQLAAFRNAWMRHVALEEHATAATAEVGRAMQSFKMLAKAGDARGEAVKAYLRGGGGRETVEEAAKRLSEIMDDPGAQSRFMRDAAKVRKRDMLNEFWVNSLLSGPKTHIVNMASNTLTALYTLPEHALTAGIGKALGTADRAYLGEVGKRAIGMMEGAREGLKLAKHAFLTGEPLDAVSKVETANFHAIPGRIGSVIRLPTRALTSADEFFKAVNRRGALNAMAYRRSQNGGATAAERMQRFNDLVMEPDLPLRAYADDEARYLTFQAPLGPTGRNIQNLVNNWTGLKLIVPFVRTPINLLKFAGERSVFAPALGEFRAAWKAGGNARNEAVARMTMGTGLSALAVTAALDGRLTGGGPTDPRERSALINSGWQPYSMKVDDRWVSYQRFDPVSMLIGAAADFAEVGTNATTKEGEDIALGLGIAVAKNVTSKTWLSGLSDFFEVLTDPERYGESWAKRMGGSLAVPALGAHVASATDPTVREVNSVLDAIKNRVPGLSHDLLARRNVWGDEIERGNGAGGSVLSSAYSFVSPVSTSKLKASPLLREVARLRAPLSMPQRRVRVDGVDRPLTPKQYAYYVQLAGKPAKAHLEEYIGTPEWKALTDAERRDYLADTLKETRADAREQLLGLFPKLAAQPDLPPLPPGYQLPPIPPGFQIAR